MEHNKPVTENEKSKITLSLFFENYEEDYRPKEIDWGKPVGREIW